MICGGGNSRLRLGGGAVLVMMLFLISASGRCALVVDALAESDSKPAGLPQCEKKDLLTADEFKAIVEKVLQKTPAST